MLVTKSVLKLIFVLSNYQTCTFPLNINAFFVAASLYIICQSEWGNTGEISCILTTSLFYDLLRFSLSEKNLSSSNWTSLFHRNPFAGETSHAFWQILCITIFFVPLNKKTLSSLELPSSTGIPLQERSHIYAFWQILCIKTFISLSLRKKKHIPLPVELPQESLLHFIGTREYMYPPAIRSATLH